jgi:2-methylcitrate dehydratase PrpD
VSKEPGITSYVVDRSRAVAWEKLPPDVVEVACQCVLDWIGGAISGGNEPLVHRLLEEAKEQGGHAQSTVVLHGLKTSPMFAALINGSAADALDYSDANRHMRGHTTPGIVAAVLAVSEARGKSGPELLSAIVAGVELACRIGSMVQPPAGLRAGFHPTGNLAPFGTTAAVAHLLGLNADQWAHALGVAATQCAGLLASGGTMSKPFHSGKAAMHGVLSANLASRGFIGRPDAIEANEGFLYTHVNKVDESALRVDEGRYLILDTIFKRHAACMLTHSSLDNMLALKAEHRVEPAQIESVDLEVQPNTLHVCNIQEPRTGLEAKFSFRAACAMALLGDDTADIGAYTAERATSADVISLRDRIKVTPKDELPGGTQVAKVELTDGRRLTIANDAYKPLGNIPLQKELVAKKFFSLVEPVVGRAVAEDIRRLVYELPKATSVAPLAQRTVR